MEMRDMVTYQKEHSNHKKQRVDGYIHPSVLYVAFDAMQSSPISFFAVFTGLSFLLHIHLVSLLL